MRSSTSTRPSPAAWRPTGGPSGRRKSRFEFRIPPRKVTDWSVIAESS